MPATPKLASKVGSSPFVALLRRVRYFALQVAGLMIAAELAHRRFVQLKQNFTQLLGFRITGCEASSVNLAQRADEGVAVAIVETCLAHAALHRARSRQRPPAGVG